MIHVRIQPVLPLRLCYSHGMKLDTESCYQAVASRDARFDGKFFTGVMTTGIYCRPICPAPLPKLKNVRFFNCAAAAQEAGFRPCRRCHPESAPHTVSWLGTSATVARALRLISEGALDGGDLEHLAARLGIGSRHLRRLFQDELGASPVAIAQTRRVHFAARLLEETGIPISDVAFGAGFNSIRRFNDVIKKSFGRTPSGIRLASERKLKNHSEGLSLRLPVKLPYDWQGVLHFHKWHTIPGIEVVDAESYRRTFALQSTVGVLEVRAALQESCLYLTLPPVDSKILHQLVEQVRSLFDCNADPTQIADHLSKDNRLAPLVQKYVGVRLPGAFDKFETSVRAILGQQISMQAANTLAGRLVKAFGEPIPNPREGLTHLFPPPEILAAADIAAVGMVQARAHTITAFAKMVIEKPTLLDAPTDLQETIAALKEIKGIGDWTANYIAMRALNEPDAFPAGDLGVRKALSTASELITAKEVEQMSQGWRPWRAYAAMYLWKSL